MIQHPCGAYVIFFTTFCTSERHRQNFSLPWNREILGDQLLRDKRDQEQCEPRPAESSQQLSAGSPGPRVLSSGRKGGNGWHCRWVRLSVLPHPLLLSPSAGAGKSPSHERGSGARAQPRPAPLGCSGAKLNRIALFPLKSFR